MAVSKIDGAALEGWVAALVAAQRMYGPVARGRRFVYDELRDARDLRLDFDVTLLPPKKYFLPPREDLLRIRRHDAAFTSLLSAEPFVLFGVHPYDVVAIAQMDALFAKDNPDPHYLTRRASATVVACDIQALSQHCFAACMDAATVNEGFDVLLTRVGGDYLVDVRTPKGEALAASLPGATPADALSLARREQLWADLRRFVRRYELQCRPEDLPALLARHYDHPLWEKRAERCYSCGSCNLVCPTCYCFDVQDDLDWDLDSGRRTRRWDGCMLTNFALVAGNHNFRKHREDRYRHRYYRKGKYLWDRMRQIACVGCGRCIGACTTRIANPVEVYNALLEER